MLIIQQKTVYQATDIAGVPYKGTQLVEHRVEIQQRHGIATMNGGRQTLQNQLQTVKITVTRDFTLTEFQLMQYRLNTFFGNTLISNFL